jgi:Flp pilus assembly pilin Flp
MFWQARTVPFDPKIIYSQNMEEDMILELYRNEKGQDMIEYALLGSFISVVAIIAIRAIGPLVTVLYENIRDTLTP